MARITADQFLETLREAEIDIDAPGLSGSVVIRELSATEAMELSTAAARGQDLDAERASDLDAEVFMEQLGVIYPKVLVYGMVDPSMTMAQVQRIPSRFMTAFMDIATEILRLSGLLDEDGNDEVEGPTDPKA